MNRRDPHTEPARIAALAHDQAGRPIPWFVQWFDTNAAGEQIATDYGEGTPDFRTIDARKIRRAFSENRCEICGRKFTGPSMTFVFGPIGFINRVTSEPPSHRECAEWAAKVCPHLANPAHAVRDAHVPEGSTRPASMVVRNPGICVLWSTHTYGVEPQPDHYLVHVGAPSRIRWWREGRPATRPEIDQAIVDALPILADEAAHHGTTAVLELGDRLSIARALIDEHRAWEDRT